VSCNLNLIILRRYSNELKSITRGNFGVRALTVSCIQGRWLFCELPNVYAAIEYAPDTHLSASARVRFNISCGIFVPLQLNRRSQFFSFCLQTAVSLNYQDFKVLLAQQIIILCEPILTDNILFDDCSNLGSCKLC
jgi:hypothetical protein